MSHKAAVSNSQKLFSVRAFFFSWDRFEVVTITLSAERGFGGNERLLADIHCAAAVLKNCWRSPCSCREQENFQGGANAEEMCN